MAAVHPAPSHRAPGAPEHPAPPPGTPSHPAGRSSAPRASRRLLAPLGALLAVAAAFAYVGAVDPNDPGHYPVCPLRQCTGLWCPGCGGLRSAHALVHGDLTGALTANAAAVAGYGLFAVCWGVWMVRAAQGRAWAPALRRGHLWTLGALLTLFTVVRNLPLGGWLHP
ncbi:DUF2752 domain-containing protein [Streptomyces sp. TS71-3]|uniref:DUF2752 domain-containing protein n=1 Tax=Streptomyces sp. TS71-3 TaxID=2733862 RepID=UPI002016CEA8|nr:DUF2752 domain-containing protein [Streptomyces sp. TS71-3]